MPIRRRKSIIILLRVAMSEFPEILYKFYDGRAFEDFEDFRHRRFGQKRERDAKDCSRFSKAQQSHCTVNVPRGQDS